MIGFWPPLKSATAATSSTVEINVSAEAEGSTNAEALRYGDICNLAIEKYVNSDSMYEPLRFEPTAPETQPEVPTVGTPAEGTATQEESEALRLDWWLCIKKPCRCVGIGYISSRTEHELMIV